MRPSVLPEPNSRIIRGFTDPRLLHELAERLWEFQPARGWRVRQEAIVSPKRFLFLRSQGQAVGANSVVALSYALVTNAITVNDGDALLFEDIEVAFTSGAANPAAGTAPALTILAYGFNLGSSILPVAGPSIPSATVGFPIFSGNFGGGSLPIRLDQSSGGGHGYIMSSEELQTAVSGAFPLAVTPVVQVVAANSTAGAVTLTVNISVLLRRFEGVESA